MAQIHDELVLEIDQALRDVNRLESALDQALAPVEVKVDVDERSLDNLKSTLDDVQRIADRAATETQSIALAAGKAEVNFEDLARAMGVSVDEARRLSAEVLQAQAGANKLEDAARDVARQLGLSDQEAERLTRSLRQADVAADAIDTTTGRVATNFGSLRSAAAGVATAFAAIGGAQLLGGAIRGTNTAIQSFARLEDSINAVNVVFGDASASVVAFGEDAAAAAGLSQEAFNQAVVPIGSLLQNFGFDAREAADAAVILVQRGADLASVYGGTVNDALLAVGAALRGEADPLERYGASISAARVETFALAEGLARTKAEITPAIALQARYGLILSDTAAVSGDFANTADDLANAQRSASASVQNFVADIGEKLAPALETILVLLPEVLEGLRQLVPGFAAAADSAAGFFESVGEGGGFRTEFAAIKAGFDLVTGGAGLAAEASGVLAAGFRGDFAGMVTAAQRGGALIERAFGRGIAVALAKALDEGTDSIVAFTAAVNQTARSSSGLDTFTGNYRDFAIAAGLSGLQLRDATEAMIDNASTIGLTADEVAFLVDQLALLNSALFTDIEAVREFNRTTRELGEEAFTTTTTRFATFASGVEDSKDRAGTALAELSAIAEAQAARTAAAFNLFEELPEKLTASFVEAVDALREQVEARVDFDINVAILRGLDLDALADDFEAKGIAAAPQLADALNHLPEAIEADLLLQGMGIIGEEAFDALVQKFVDSHITGSDVQKLRDGLASPEVIAAAEAAAVIVATRQTGSYQRALDQQIDQIIPETADHLGRSIETHWRLEDEASGAGEDTGQSFLDGVLARITPDSIKGALGTFGLDIDLTDDGIEAGITLITGMVIGVKSPAATDRLRDAIVDATRNALEMQSPSKVMMDLGQQAGGDFWSGWNQAELTLRTPSIQPTGGLITTSTTGQTVGGDANVQLIINNPTMKDAVSDAERLKQIAGSVASTYNQVRN